MTETISLPAPAFDPVTTGQSKWEREYRAFQRLLPQLLATHSGQYVAIHEGQVVDSGADRLAVALRVLAKIGNVPIHVGRVALEPEAISRSGLRRDARLDGGVA